MLYCQFTRQPLPIDSKMSNRNNVFIYWDNSNIFISAKEAAAVREGDGASGQVRIHFRNLMASAAAGRPIKRAVAVGSVPPELQLLWNRMENQDVEVHLSERGAQSGKEVNEDQALHSNMLRDVVDYNGDPGIAVLLTGDGAGFSGGRGFHADLVRMHNKGWRIEVLSWQESCNRRMKEWAIENGTFIPLDDFYNSITFLESPQPGQPHAAARIVSPLDLSKRKI